MNRSLKALAIAAVVGMFAVQLVGTLVTKSGSADGCGASWPLCDGSLLPAANIHSVIEYSHRVISGIVGLLVFAFAYLVWRRLPDRPDARYLGLTGVAFIIIQSALGAAAVLWPQPKMVLALHFGISLTAFAAVLLPAVIIAQVEKGTTHRQTPVGRPVRTWAWIGLLYVYGVIYTGAYVRHTNSHMACLDWPLCNGALIPELSGAVGIQFFHRLAAAFMLVVLGWLVKVTMGERERRPDVYRAGLLIGGLGLAQVLSGGWVILSHLSMTAMMVHSAIVTCLFGALSYLCLQVSREPAVRVEAGAPGRMQPAETLR